MSNSRDKFENSDHVYWDNQEPIRKINNTLTPIQAVSIVNRLLLHVDNKILEHEAEVLKQWIKSR